MIDRYGPDDDLELINLDWHCEDAAIANELVWLQNTLDGEQRRQWIKRFKNSREQENIKKCKELCSGTFYLGHASGCPFNKSCK